MNRAQSSKSLGWLAFPSMILVLWVGFGLRIYRIAAQSYWYDEGVSVVMAQKDLISIAISSAADIHPPLYYYFLRLWVLFVGTDEFALRWLSLAFGVMTVAVVFKLGQKLFDWQIGLAGALFAAMATFPIYYSQEVRMYMQVTFLGCLSTYLFLSVQSDALKRAGTGHKNRRLVAYTLVSIALLYSHYFAFSILAFQNIFMLIKSLGGQNSPSAAIRSLMSWFVLQVIIVLSFAPWLIISFSQLSGWPSISEPFGFDTLLLRVFRVFTFGLSWDAAATTKREGLFLVLLASSGLAPLIARARRQSFPATHWISLVFPFLYCLVPVLIMYLLSLRKPMYNPKFLLLATPGYYLLLGIGIMSLGRAASGAFRSISIVPQLVRHSVGAIVVIVLLYGALFSISKSTLAYYFDPKYARDDYRGAAHFIERQAEEGDAIVLNAPGQIEIFGLYFKGKQEVYPLPSERPMDKQKTDAELKKITDKHKRIWLVLWAQTESDPEGFVERWLDENSFKTSNSWFGGVRLVQYVVAGGSAAWQEESDAIFGDSIRLKSIRIGSASARPGDILDVTLQWQAIKVIKERYTVFLHVIDDNDYLWGQRDSEPGGGNRLTTSWDLAETVEDRHGVPVLLGTPPGRYRLELGLYQPDTGKRLTIVNREGQVIGDRLLFGQVDVLRSPSSFRPETLEIRNRKPVSFGGLRLLGFDYHKLGQSPTSTDLQTGDTALATLYWQGAYPIPQDYVVELEVATRDGMVKLRYIAQPGGAHYPTSEWNPGSLVRDQRKLSLVGQEQGEYSLRMRVSSTDLKSPVMPDGGSMSPDGSIELLKFQIK